MLKFNIKKTEIIASGPFMSKRWGKMKTVTDFIFLGSKITMDSDCCLEIKRCLFLGRKAIITVDSILKSYQFTNKGLSSQNYGFPSSHVWMWELDHKEGWVLKNWCFWTVVLEKILESPLDARDQTSQSERKSVPNIHWKDCGWSSNTLATWCEELTH